MPNESFQSRIVCAPRFGMQRLRVGALVVEVSPMCRNMI